MQEMINAGIVLYNPDLVRLDENISHIIKQVHSLIIVNNGSKNTTEIDKLLKKYPECKYIKFEENKGVAAALNRIVEECLKEKVEYVITLDQDSVCHDNLVENYRKYLNLPQLGQLCCLYQDRNFIEDNSPQYDGVKEVSWCITSAALLNNNVWKEIGGFDERLFIDQVDYDICLSMREKGYKIYQAGFIGFLHEIGEGKKREFGKFHIKTWNHSPIRRYYGVRNAIWVGRKHKELNNIRVILGAVKHIFIIFIFEGDKYNKLKAGLRGLKDGIIIKQ